MRDDEQYWTNVAAEQLKGRKIVDVRYLSKEEAEGLDWLHRPVVIVLDDGNQIFPSSDDEGNNAGSLFTTNSANDVLPVLRDTGL